MINQGPSVGNVLKDKSFSFALRIVKLCRYLSSEFKEYILSNQLLRSGTSIGANVEESINAQSKSDFIHKLSIAQKEAGETHYWLRLLRESGYLTSQQSQDIILDCEEIQKILTASIKTAKDNLAKSLVDKKIKH